MKLAIGCDHGGYELKQEMIQHLQSKGYEITDVGCDSPTSCDYPVYAKKVTELIRSGEFVRHINRVRRRRRKSGEKGRNMSDLV